MKVAAMLAWYDEHPDTLHRAVTSLACIADRLIAADGRWDLHPGESDTSPLDQYQAIQTAADEAGIDLELHPGRAWTGQVAKRQFMLDQATQHADWVMPLDADWELHGDREQVRAELEATAADALEVPFHTPANPDKPLDDTAATYWHRNMAGRTEHHALIYRALEDMRVERFHWCYSGVKNGVRVAVWGNEGRYPQADTAPLRAPFRIDHWCLHRDERTVLANREYCERRAEYVTAHGTEPL